MRLANWSFDYLIRQDVPGMCQETDAFVYLKTQSRKDLYGYVVAALLAGYTKPDIVWYLGLKTAGVAHILEKYKPHELSAAD